MLHHKSYLKRGRGGKAVKVVREPECVSDDKKLAYIYNFADLKKTFIGK